MYEPMKPLAPVTATVPEATAGIVELWLPRGAASRRQTIRELRGGRSTRWHATASAGATPLRAARGVMAAEASDAVISAATADCPKQLLIVEQIGRGSYGAVFKALYDGSQIVAAKAVPLDAASDSTGLSGDLQNEVALMRECDSPFIVRLLQCLKKQRTLWICMELCDGGSVVDVLRRTRSPLREDEVAAVASAVVRGLHYLHTERKILHRDIKAGNVLLTTAGGGGVKLCDLGVSASVSSHTKRSTVIGTPLWMSPELIESGAYGASTDVWSLGITALEMAEMAPPHHDVNPTIRALFLITAQPAPTLRDPAAWTDDFGAFIGRCLQKDIGGRADSTELLDHPFVARGVSLGMAPVLTMIERATQAAAAGGGARDGDGESDGTVDMMAGTRGGGRRSNGTLDSLSTLGWATRCRCIIRTRRRGGRRCGRRGRRHAHHRRGRRGRRRTQRCGRRHRASGRHTAPRRRCCTRVAAAVAAAAGHAARRARRRARRRAQLRRDGPCL